MRDTTEILPIDQGPVYYETDLNRLIVEPFNAFSSLAMAVAAILIWTVLLKGDYRKNYFLSLVFTPLLFLGGLGSTLFHAFRATPFFLYMDVLPVFLLTILLSLFYWYKLYPKWYFAVLMFFLIIIGRAIPVSFFEGSAAINISYFLSGVLILIPMTFRISGNRFYAFKFVIYSLFCLIIALLFRYTDDYEYLILPMGTHWLWHIGTGFGAWFLGVYIFKTETVKKTESSAVKL